MQHESPSQYRGNWPHSVHVVLLALTLLCALTSLSCSSASRELRFQHPSPAPSVVYVAEQVVGMEEWVRGPEARSFARVYTREGAADEGQLVRITANAVVLADGQQSSEISRDNVLFMRVWW